MAGHAGRSGATGAGAVNGAPSGGAADVERLLTDADQAMARGDPATVERLLMAALALDPAIPKALNWLAMQAQRRGDFAGATGLFARATAADPKAPELWLNRANAERALGRDDAVLASLTGALAADPNFVPARLLRGAEAERRGDHVAAIEDYGLALAMLPETVTLPPQLERLVAQARSALAAHNASLAAALESLLSPARAAAPLPRRFERLVDVMTGKGRVWRSQPAGIDYPGLPAIEFFDRADFPWFADLEAATDAIRAEYLALFADAPDADEPYVAYRPGEPVNQWAGLNHSKRWGVRFLMRDGEPRPEVRDRCPQTAALLDRLPLLDIPGRGPSAFFSVLAPRTRIPAHTGSTNLRSIVHLGLIVPPECGFRVGGETRAWREGDAFAFDDTIEHEAWNDSDAPRVVLILDCWNPALDIREKALVRELLAGIEQHRGTTSAWSDG